MDATPNFGGAATDAGAGRGHGARLQRHVRDRDAGPEHRRGGPAAAGTFSVRAAPLASGTYTAVAEQADAAGNVGRSSRRRSRSWRERRPVGARRRRHRRVRHVRRRGDRGAARPASRARSFTLGDHVYEDATASDFTNCYDPTWGRHKARTRPRDRRSRVPDAGRACRTSTTSAPPPAIPRRATTATTSAPGTSIVAQRGVQRDRRLRRRLAAGAVAARRPRGAPRRSARWRSCTSRASAPGAIHGSSATYQPFWQALYDFGAELVLSGDDHVYERFAPQTPTGARRSRPRHPRDHRRHRRPQPLRVRDHPAQQRGPQQRRVRGAPGDAARRRATTGSSCPRPVARSRTRARPPATERVQLSTCPAIRTGRARADSAPSRRRRGGCRRSGRCTGVHPLARGERRPARPRGRSSCRSGRTRPGSPHEPPPVSPMNIP